MQLPRLGQLFVQRTVAELPGVKLPHFRILAYFPHTKPLKSTFRWPAYTAQGLHRKMITIFPRGSERSEGVPSGSGVFLGLLVGQLGTPNLPTFSPIANGYAHTESYYTARQTCTKAISKRAVLRTDILSSIYAPAPKITPKTHFGGPFNAKPIIERASKSHVNGTTKVKVYR